MIWIIIITFIVVIAIALRKRELVKNLAPYLKKDRVMNDSEQALFINLHKHLGEEFIILSKVRIEDFVEVIKNRMPSNEEYGARGRIKSRHADFLICDRVSTKPLLALELDGNSHMDWKRQKRDLFVNDLYEKIGLAVRYIHVGDDFNTSAQKVREMLKENKM
jgi:hypothetical protein